jgi:hypothetical protein
MNLEMRRTQQVDLQIERGMAALLEKRNAAHLK